MRPRLSLRQYQAKRNFSRTREPAGRPAPSKERELLTFVVQKHAASHLHYDFRLQMEGVLKSWAVPRGFPTQRGDRRLAVQVEDHPIEYEAFEGTIPEGNYGAGTVMVWDRGTYSVEGGEPAQALAQGKLHLFLEGTKLKGEWTLVRMRGRGSAEKPQWLLIKSGNDIRPFSEAVENRSALSGRSLTDIRDAEGGAEWRSNRAKGGHSPALSRLGRGSQAQTNKVKTASANVSRTKKLSRKTVLSRKAADLADSKLVHAALDSLPQARPGFVEPMKALLRDKLPRGKEWSYEIKFDGVRALGLKDGNTVRLISRAGNELAGRYPALAEAISELSARDVLLDGEIVALDPEGRSNFQLLQSYLNAGKKPPLFYYVFDILNFEGRNLMQLPLSKRKELAALVLRDSPAGLRFSPAIHAPAERVLGEMKARGLEGILAKRQDSLYEAGRRSGSWVKFKWTHEQEFVIGGYTQPRGGRSHFGALLVGYYSGTKLLFAAKVGTGFDQKSLSSLFKTFQRLRQDSCPFVNLPEKLPGNRGGITASQMRQCTWLKPQLVCQIRFAEWTKDSHLRQPAFLGLREDKRPAEVVREVPAAV